MADLYLSFRVRAMFLQLQRKRRWRRERPQKERCVCVCVGGRGAEREREPCKRYGDCLTLSASVSMVTVTAAWWWQACREARGPCVAPHVTLLSACQYFCTWHTVLSYYHNCSIGMSTECQGSTSGTGQLYRRHFSFFYFRTASTPQSSLRY